MHPIIASIAAENRIISSCGSIVEGDEERKRERQTQTDR